MFPIQIFIKVASMGAILLRYLLFHCTEVSMIIICQVHKLHHPTKFSGMLLVIVHVDEDPNQKQDEI